MAAWKIAAPLGAGCTFAMKPSEITPPGTSRLAEMLADMMPRDVLYVAHGRAASDQIRHVHLELGAKPR